MSDIVQAIDALSLDAATHNGPERFRVCAWLTMAEIARLRELRDRIVEDRKAFLALGRASAVLSDGTGYKIALTDNAKARDSVATERALLAFCREVGT